MGINSEFTRPHTAIVDPDAAANLATCRGVPTLMDCYIHCVEIAAGHRSGREAKSLSTMIMADFEHATLQRFRPNDPEWRLRAAMCSVLGGVALSGGTVGACHAISYGLSNSLGIRHGIANLMAFQHLGEIYGEHVPWIIDYCHRAAFSIPAVEVNSRDANDIIDACLRTSLSMEALWCNVFPADDWRSSAEKLSLEVLRKLIAA